MAAEENIDNRSILLLDARCDNTAQRGDVRIGGKDSLSEYIDDSTAFY